MVLQLCVVSGVVWLGDSVLRNNESCKQGLYLCNVDCIMLIRTKIMQHRLIPLDEERKIPPVT